MRVGILTISTTLAHGVRLRDLSGDAIAAFVTGSEWHADIVERAAVADDRDAIRRTLIAWADGGTVDLILSTGGTGLAPTDVTPEATLEVIDRVAPGIAEAMRAETAVKTPLAWLSRGVAGARGKTLIINLPGSPKAVTECLDVLAPIVPHATDILTGVVRQHEPPKG